MKTPIDTLIQDVTEAIEKYDASGDHSSHAPGADCIVCHVLAALPNYAITAYVNRKRTAEPAPQTDAFRGAAAARARECVKRARDKWGNGWTLLSSEQREGAVALQVLALLLGQDEETAKPQVRRLQLIAEMALDGASPQHSPGIPSRLF